MCRPREYATTCLCDEFNVHTCPAHAGTTLSGGGRLVVMRVESGTIGISGWRRNQPILLPLS